MPTFITNGNDKNSLSGSTEKRLDMAPDGTLWALVVSGGDPGKAKFFKSTNGGSTWSYSSGSDISLEQATSVPSLYIDADGYAHVAWSKWLHDPQVIRYARGKPKTGGGWSWSTVTISPAGGRTTTDVDVIAHKTGAGWTVWVSWGLGTSGGAKVSRVAVNSAGSISVTTTQHGPSAGGGSNQIHALEWNHNGDGKTSLTDPHLYFMVASGAGSTGPIYVHRALHSGGTWTWQTPVQVIASATLPDTTMTCVWDGARLMGAYAANSATINVFEWDGSAGSVTFRNPPAAPGGTGVVQGLSLSHDPVTDDLYLTYYDATDGDIRWSKFTRGTLTWSAWAVFISRSANALYDDGKIQQVRHPGNDAVDLIYVHGPSGSTYPIYSNRLATLPRTPSAPTLNTPASGSKLDLANGGTFVWTYNPVALGDTQQAWSFRRKLGATTEYWNNSSKTWGASQVWNSGSSTTVSFDPAKWTNGNTYQWAVASRSSSSGLDSVFSGDRSVVATSAPVVDVTAPDGIVYGEDTPLVTWDYTSLDPQATYRVRIIQEQAGIDPDTTPPVWDSGVANSAIARSARVETPLTNGVAYRAYVQATSTTAITSVWDYLPFTISITSPTGPIVDAVAETYAPTGVPRAALTLTATTSFLTQNQDVGPTVEWGNDANTTIVFQDDDTGLQVTAGLKLTSVASGTMRIVTNLGSPPAAPVGEPQPAGPLNFPVIAGMTYTGLASLKASGTTRSGRIKIRWYDADDGTGALISESSGSLVSVTNVAYVLASLTATAPANAVMARLVVEITGPTAAGEIFYMTRPSFHHGSNAAWTPGGYAQTQTLRIERSIDAGTTWIVIEDRLKTNLYQQATTYDRTMPLGIPVQYRAYTVVDLGETSLTSAVGPADTETIPSTLWTIRDPQDDLGEMLAYVVGHDRSDDEASSVHWPAGREFPIVDTEGVHGATGSLDVFVFNAALEASLGILRRTVPMVVQSPNGLSYYVRLIRRNYKIEAVRHRVIDVTYVEIGEI